MTFGRLNGWRVRLGMGEMRRLSRDFPVVRREARWRPPEGVTGGGRGRWRFRGEIRVKEKIVKIQKKPKIYPGINQEY